MQLLASIGEELDERARAARMLTAAITLGMLGAASLGCRGHSAGVVTTPAESPEPADAGVRSRTTTLATSGVGGEALRVFHTQAIGRIEGHRWSEDERLLAVWSRRMVVVSNRLTERESRRYVPPNGRHVLDAGFSPDGNWTVVVSRAPAAELSTVELFARGESAPRRRLVRVAGCGWIHDCWQFTADNRAIAWLEAAEPDSNPSLRLHVETLAGPGEARTYDVPSLPQGGLSDGARGLPEVAATDGAKCAADDAASGSESGCIANKAYGIELSRASGVIAVYRESQFSLIESATGRAWHFRVNGSAVMAPSGEAAAWSERDGDGLWRRGDDRVLALTDRRCSPRHWPQRAAARILFSDDERTVATSGSTGVCLWDVGTGQLRTTLRAAAAPSESEFPVEPRAWTHSGSGLVVANADGNQLWDVGRRRIVRSGFTDWSPRGNSLLILDVPLVLDAPIQILAIAQPFDSTDSVRKIAEAPQAHCGLDRWSSDVLLVGFEHTAAVWCQPDPWFVDLSTFESRLVRLPAEGREAVSPLHPRLTVTMPHGLLVIDPSSPGSAHPVIRELGSSRRSRLDFEGARLRILERRGSRRFTTGILDFGGGTTRFVSTSITNPCGNRHVIPFNARFAAAYSNGEPPAICDLSNGREVARLQQGKPDQLLGLSSDGRLALLSNKIEPGRFWFVTEDRVRDASVQISSPLFVGPRTVVGGVDGKVVSVDVETGAASTGWDYSSSQQGEMLAADAASQLVVTGGDHPALRRLEDGKIVVNLPVPELTAAALGPNRVMVGGDDQRIWLWHLPAPEPVGELLVDAAGALFIASDGRFETTSPIEEWKDSLACAVGQKHLPLAACVQTLYEPGLILRALGRESGHDGAVRR